MATANIETIPTPHTNGVIEDDYEEEKSKMRPADIDADVREMERRKRVELIMNSRLFREELERIIETQMRHGYNSDGLLQQISDMFGSKYIMNNHLFKSSNCVAPINDMRGVEAMGYAKGEKILRCKLAALFRLIDLHGWSQCIYNHITARLSQQEEHFLVNPYGLLYNEVTASSLVKVDMQGNVIEPGTTNFSVNVGGFQLHAAIYAARPDLKCIVHLHTSSVLAVSSLKDGLLPLCQEAAIIGEVSHHSYVGVPTDSEERDKIARNLGPNNKVIFLTNHGALCCGETIEETFFYVRNTVNACETQLKVMPFGKDNLVLLSEETRKAMYDAVRKVPENLAPPASHMPSAAAATEKRVRLGGLEFEALMRMLDNSGFRTGYIYRQPLIKSELPRTRNDVEVPPAVSSLGYLLEEEEYYKQGLWKRQHGTKGNDRIRWLNSPNVYQKVEILETGTSDPKKITKWVDANNEEWVADGSPSHTSTPVKIENALQFVPKNTNPKEFKKLQQQIKENRRADKITSGPQSHILEGVSWEEAKKLQDANISGTSDQVILVGAASKGIIQREYQHNATVYKTPYAKNPFDAITDEEIENYKKDITRKQRGDSYYDEDESDAISSSLPPSGKNAAVTSETEDDSLTHDMKVIQIQTSTAPKESRAEVVLSDDFGLFFNTNIAVARVARIWEIRKMKPVLCVIATIRVHSYPFEHTEPKIVHVDSDQEPAIDLNVIVDTYRYRERTQFVLKGLCKQITDELIQKFRNGDIFQRSAQSAFRIYSSNVPQLCDPKFYSQPAARSFDSSEVEYTTLVELPHPGQRKYSESPHDFSSSGTTEDEDEPPSPPDEHLKKASSWSSLTSCIGTDYEEVQPPKLDFTLNELNELTASFTTVSEDASGEDITAIFCPLSKSMEINTSEMSLSDDASSVDNLSMDSVSDDEENSFFKKNTYSRLSSVDFDENVDKVTMSRITAEECSTSFKSNSVKFQTDLSVIYEENVEESTFDNFSCNKRKCEDSINVNLSHPAEFSVTELEISSEIESSLSQEICNSCDSEKQKNNNVSWKNIDFDAVLEPSDWSEIVEDTLYKKSTVKVTDKCINERENILALEPIRCKAVCHLNEYDNNERRNENKSCAVKPKRETIPITENASLARQGYCDSFSNANTKFYIDSDINVILEENNVTDSVNHNVKPGVGQLKIDIDTFNDENGVMLGPGELAANSASSNDGIFSENHKTSLDMNSAFEVILVSVENKNQEILKTEFIKKIMKSTCNQNVESCSKNIVYDMNDIYSEESKDKVYEDVSTVIKNELTLPVIHIPNNAVIMPLKNENNVFINSMIKYIKTTQNLNYDVMKPRVVNLNHRCLVESECKMYEPSVEITKMNFKLPFDHKVTDDVVMKNVNTDGFGHFSLSQSGLKSIAEEYKVKKYFLVVKKSELLSIYEAGTANNFIRESCILISDELSSQLFINRLFVNDNENKFVALQNISGTPKNYILHSILIVQQHDNVDECGTAIKFFIGVVQEAHRSNNESSLSSKLFDILQQLNFLSNHVSLIQVQSIITTPEIKEFDYENSVSVKSVTNLHYILRNVPWAQIKSTITVCKITEVNNECSIYVKFPNTLDYSKIISDVEQQSSVIACEMKKIVNNESSVSIELANILYNIKIISERILSYVYLVKPQFSMASIHDVKDYYKLTYAEYTGTEPSDSPEYIETQNLVITEKKLENANTLSVELKSILSRIHSLSHQILARVQELLKQSEASDSILNVKDDGEHISEISLGDMYSETFSSLTVARLRGPCISLANSWDSQTLSDTSINSCIADITDDDILQSAPNPDNHIDMARLDSGIQIEDLELVKSGFKIHKDQNIYLRRNSEDSDAGFDDEEWTKSVSSDQEESKDITTFVKSSENLEEVIEFSLTDEVASNNSIFNETGITCINQYGRVDTLIDNVDQIYHSSKKNSNPNLNKRGDIIEDIQNNNNSVGEAQHQEYITVENGNHVSNEQRDAKYNCSKKKITDCDKPSRIRQTYLSLSDKDQDRLNEKISEFSLKLSLHIEWDNEPIVTGASFNENSPCNRQSHESDYHDESFNVKKSVAPQLQSPSLLLLRDFKCNYPKFIQYSDFSPKIKRTPNAKRNCRTSPLNRIRKTCLDVGAKSTKATRCWSFTNESQNDGAYHHYSEVSADWSSLNRCKSFKKSPDISPRLKEPTFYDQRYLFTPMLSDDDSTKTNSLLNRNLESIVFKTSTPKDEKNDVLTYPVLSPIVSSLEEFEILESLLENQQ